MFQKSVIVNDKIDLIWSNRTKYSSNFGRSHFVPSLEFLPLTSYLCKAILLDILTFEQLYNNF